MANISELAARTPGAEPAWIAALAHSAGFVAQADVAPRDEPAVFEKQSVIERQQAEAYRKGCEDGAEEAERRHQGELQVREKLRLALTRLDDAAKAALRQHLAETVALLCEQVIEPHLVDRDAIAARCASLAEAIGEAAQNCTLHINPADAPLVSEAHVQGWKIRQDAALQRGTLKLEGREGMVRDGPEDWRRAFLQALLP